MLEVEEQADCSASLSTLPAASWQWQDHVVAIEPDVFRQLAAEALAQAEISNT